MQAHPLPTLAALARHGLACKEAVGWDGGQSATSVRTPCAVWWGPPAAEAGKAPRKMQQLAGGAACTPIHPSALLWLQHALHTRML